MLDNLHLTNGKELSLIAWLGEFAAVADSINLKFDKKALAERLTNYGYTADAFIGLPQGDYNRKAILAGYLIGQAISQLNSGMPLHPMLNDWCNKYKELD